MPTATAKTREHIVDAIASRLRSGVAYRYCDTDGYHDEVAFRDGHYVHVDGFRAVSNAPLRLASEEAAITLVCAIHPRTAAASEIEVLESILATLEDRRSPSSLL